MIGISPALWTLIQNLLCRSCRLASKLFSGILVTGNAWQVCINIFSRKGLNIIRTTEKHDWLQPALCQAQRQDLPLCRFQQTFVHRQSRRSPQRRPCGTRTICISLTRHYWTIKLAMKFYTLTWKKSTMKTTLGVDRVVFHWKCGKRQHQSGSEKETTSKSNCK